MQTSIRFIEEADLQRIAQLANDRDIAKMTAQLPYPYTLSDAQTWFSYVQRTEHEHVFAICSGDSLIGVIGLVLEAEHKRAELGFWLGKPYWNRGHASAAAQMMVGYAFSALGVTKIYAKCFGVNDVSKRVLEKNEFVLEGTLKQHYIRMGDVQDIQYYGLLKTDYEKSVK